MRGARLRILGRKIVTNGGAQEYTEFASQFFRHKNIRAYLFSRKGRGALCTFVLMSKIVARRRRRTLRPYWSREFPFGEIKNGGKGVLIVGIYLLLP